MKKKPFPSNLIIVILLILIALYFILQKNNFYQMENPYSSDSENAVTVYPTTNPEELTPEKTSLEIDTTLQEIDKTTTPDTFSDLQ